MSQYDTEELSPEAVKALKKVIDQYAAVEVITTELMAEVAKLSPMTDNAAREIQYAFGENRASLYGQCDNAIGEAVGMLGAASATIKSAHEGARAMLIEGTGGKVVTRRPRTKALHAFAKRLQSLWPGPKFGR